MEAESKMVKSQADFRDFPDGYRLTELGPLPEEWRVVRLGEVVEEIVERVSDSKDLTAQSLPVLSLTKNEGLILQTERFNKRIATEDVSSYKIVRRGQIVYNPYVIWEGAIHILRKYEAGLVSPVYPVLKAKEMVADPYYLDAWLRTPSAIAAYNRFAAGAVNRRRAIRKRDFWEIKIPLPPLPEQRAIAHVLRAVQEAKEATERVIAAARELKKSLMRHLFTYGPVPVDQADAVEMQETELGPLPAHWRVVKLGEVVGMKQGMVLPTKKFTASGFPVYGANGQIGWYSEYTHEDSEVLVTCRGATCGTVNVTPPRAFITNNAMVVTPKRSKRLSKSYLAYALMNSDLSSTVTGTGQPQITKATLSLYPIPLPPVSEQREIARMLQAVHEKIRAEEGRKQALEALFKTLLHDLMTAKRRLPKEFIAQFNEGDGHE